MNPSTLPVAVIGAGPIGLAAATHLLARGESPLVLEAGALVATNVRAWGHVHLFSPWAYNIDPAAARLLESHGWDAPDPAAVPTGGDLVTRYLAPLAALPPLAPRIRLNSRVLAVSRQGFDKMKTVGREAAPFLLSVVSPDGTEEGILAKAVIDASGTYGSPNPLGASGVPATGERALADRIFYGIPDILGAHRARYAGKRVLVVGSGHSAFNALLDLGELTESAPRTEITWAVRRRALGQIFGGGERDLLPARGHLGTMVRRLVEEGTVRLVTGFRVDHLGLTDEGVVVAGEDTVLPPVDELVATTGFRPDLSLLRELRLDLDPAVESPRALAPLIDPNVHSCGTVPPHGAEELRQPEPNVYVVGMKSYGRAPTFLMLTGYEQVRSVAAAIAGDWEAARDVRLELPETGVCSGDGRGTAQCGVAVGFGNVAARQANGGGSGCCGSAIPVLQVAGGAAEAQSR